MRGPLLCFLVLLLPAVLACGDGRVPGMAGNDSTLVGGPCMSADDCDFRLCQEGAIFPGGICTLSCSNDKDCPSGSSCGDFGSLDIGWVCLVNCSDSSDCREQWTCESINRPASGDTAPTSFDGCIGPLPEG